MSPRHCFVIASVLLFAACGGKQETPAATSKSEPVVQPAPAANVVAATSPITAPVPAKVFPADIVRRDGQKIELSDLQRLEGSFSSDIGVPIDAPVPGHHSFVIDNGELQIVVPFEIIREVNLVERKDPADSFNAWLDATVRLGDGSTLAGQFVGVELGGRTGVGQLTLDLTSWWGHMPPTPSIASITFRHEAVTSYAYEGRGRRSLVVHKLGGGEIAVTKAAVLRAHPDQNGFYTEGVIGDVRIRAELGKYNVDWDRIATFVPKESKVVLPFGRYDFSDLTLTVDNGQSVEGRSGDIIEGVANIAGKYDLCVRLPLQRGGYARIDARNRATRRRAMPRTR